MFKLKQGESAGIALEVWLRPYKSLKVLVPMRIINKNTPLKRAYRMIRWQLPAMPIDSMLQVTYYDLNKPNVLDLQAVNRDGKPVKRYLSKEIWTSRVIKDRDTTGLQNVKMDENAGDPDLFKAVAAYNIKPDGNPRETLCPACNKGTKLVWLDGGPLCNSCAMAMNL